jgi:hypothetical protein
MAVMTKEERAAAAAARKAAREAVRAMDAGAKGAALAELLTDKKLAEGALEELLEGWAQTLGGKNPSRLSWVRNYFGTKFEREGQERFRAARLSEVLAKLVRFCLSAADRDPATEAELGLFELTADPKTAEALTTLADSTEGVVVTTRQYAAFMKVMRLLEEQGESFKLADGKSIKGYVGELLPEGFRGVKTFTEKEEYKKRRAAYDKGKASK